MSEPSTEVTVNDEKWLPFRDNYTNLVLPHGSVSSILTHAFRALIGAEVINFEGGVVPDNTQITVHGGRVSIFVEDEATGAITNLWWVPQGDLPSFAPAMDALLQLLESVLNSPPWAGPLDHPHTRN